MINGKKFKLIATSLLFFLIACYLLIFCNDNLWRPPMYVHSSRKLINSGLISNKNRLINAEIGLISNKNVLINKSESISDLRG